MPWRHVLYIPTSSQVTSRKADGAVQKKYCTSLPAAYYDTESTDGGGNRTEGEEKGKEENNKQNQQSNPPPYVYPTGECEEGGPSRGTPWWPPQPLAYLLEFIVVHVISVVLASFASGASRVLFHCITLYCTEHSLQYGMLFLVI